MQVRFYPSEPAGVVKAPPSKSMAHRLLIAAGLSEGESMIRGAALSEDILATLDCLESMGAGIFLSGTDEQGSAGGTDIRILGIGSEKALSGFPAQGSRTLLCRESGSTLRFFTPLCLLSGEQFLLKGSDRLLNRPLSVYEDLCAKQGLLFRKSAGELRVQGPLRAGEFHIPGNISSQFVTGLLFALPLLKEDSVIRLLPPVESGPYIDMTLKVLRAFGARIGRRMEGDGFIFEIPGGQRLTGTDMEVEGDWSNAAPFLAMGLTVTGLKPDSLQGDRVILRHLKAIAESRPVISLADCPDLGPVLFAAAALHRGAVFTETRRLKEKESDRGEAMCAELRKCGVEMENLENRIVVGCGVHAPEEVIDCHNDHRIVMALSLVLSKTGGVMTGLQAVRKSFPDYFEVLRRAGIQFQIS